MTPFEIYLMVVIGLVVAYALKTSFGGSTLESTDLEPKPKVELRVVQAEEGLCGKCRAFSVKGAKAIFRQQGAFTDVQQHLAPWQYFNPPKLVTNPEWEELEAKLDEINEAMLDADPQDIERSAELEAERQRLLDEQSKLTPKLLQKPGPTDIDPRDLALTWDDFGYCEKHRELRTKPDGCPDFEERLS